MNKIVCLFIVSVFAFQAYAQNEIEVDTSILNRSYTIELAESYLDSNKTEETLWVLINSVDQDEEEAESLVKKIKGDKSDSVFIRFVEDVFWAYAPTIQMVPDDKTKTFHVFEDYIFWKNELIAFTTMHGKEALRLDELAQKQMAEGNNKAAVESYSASIKLIPTARRYYRRAQLYEALGENQKALNDYDSSIELNSYPAHYYARGKLNLGLRYLDDAIRDYTHLIDSKFEFLLHEAYLNRAHALAMIADNTSNKQYFKLAIQDYTKSIDIQPTAEAYKRRALCYHSIENLEQSIKDLLNAVELDPEDAVLYFFLGAFGDDYKKRINYLNKSIELNPNDSDAIGLRGIIYYNKGKKKKACKDFKKAMELGDKESEEHYKNFCR